MVGVAVAVLGRGVTAWMPAGKVVVGGNVTCGGVGDWRGGGVRDATGGSVAGNVGVKSGTRGGTVAVAGKGGGTPWVGVDNPGFVAVGMAGGKVAA